MFHYRRSVEHGTFGADFPLGTDSPTSRFQYSSNGLEAWRRKISTCTAVSSVFPLTWINQYGMHGKLSWHLLELVQHVYTTYSLYTTSPCWWSLRPIETCNHVLWCHVQRGGSWIVLLSRLELSQSQLPYNPISETKLAEPSEISILQPVGRSSKELLRGCR